MTRTALRGVRVFDGHRLGGPRTVVIDGPVIGADPTGAREVDASGATLLPGLIDAHVHLHGPDDLHALACWGVTTALDMACWPPERVASLRAVTGAADFRTPGLPAIGPGGPHSRMPSMPPEAVVRTPEDARRHVAARVAEGVDYVKGVAEAPGEGGPPAEALDALVVAAREHGLTTIVHAASAGAYALAVGSGADVVTHVPIRGTVSASDAEALVAAGRTAVPTLAMGEAILAAVAPGAPLDGLLHSVATLHRAGVPVLAGTDANDEPGSPGAVPHGESLHRELELLVRAGLSPVEALRAATVLPARAFGLTDRGAVEPGLRADLVLVDGDPTVDVSATRRLRAVWCAGEPVPLTSR